MINPRKLLVLAYLLALAVPLAFQVAAFRAYAPLLEDHRLLDPDSYTWMSRAQRLRDGGSWYDEVEPRANWPFGERVHYNRPFDVLLLAGAAALTPLLGAADGLYWWGVMVSPAFYLAVAVALASGVSSLLGRWRGPLAVLLLATQFGVFNYALPARADHHMVIMLLFVLTWALVSRVLRNPASRRDAILAGGVAGLGLWVSLEFMLMLVACHGALAVSWVRRGGAIGRAAVEFSLGVVSVAVIALLAEHPPQEWLVAEYDGFSIVHLLVMGIAASFWIVLTRAAQTGQRPSSVRERLQLAVSFAGVGLSSIWIFMPRVLLSPQLLEDPRAAAVLGAVGELASLWPTDFAGLLKLGLMLGIGLLALPGLIYLLVRERAAVRHDEWVFLAIAIGIYLPLALSTWRIAPYAEILLVIVAAEVLMRMGEAIRRTLPAWPRGLAAGTAISAVLVAAYFLTAFFSAVVTYNQATMPRFCDSRLHALAGFLNALGAERHAVFTIAGLPELGPELLYRTPHRVIATPHWSNEQGAIAIYDLLMAEDDRVPKRIVGERGINLFVVCKIYPQQNPFFARLIEGRGPEWVGELALPAVLDEYYALFATRL